jgi:hypothetical protein
MMGKKSIAVIVGVCTAAIYGSLVLVGIKDHWPKMSLRVLVLLSGAVFVALYFAGKWIGVRSEQNKKLPTSSKELRRRTKEFYDRLASQVGLTRDDNH